MSNPEKPFIINVDGRQRQLVKGNCEINFFRDEPDKDYLSIKRSREGSAEVDYTWLFGRREMLVWMGRLCVQRGDQKLLHAAEREHDSFRENFGWNPDVCVYDRATQFETDIYVQYLLSDDLDHPERLNQPPEE